MASIIPLPSTRVSGMLVRQRLLAQMQGDQLDLFRLQNQVSTGQRFTLPSEDAPAARRAMTLQRLLERKTQLRSNVETGQSFLKSTDVALNNVAGLLGDIRGVALGASGTTSTETQRQAAITEINRALEQLVSVGNTQFRGRYLFSGSQTNVEPYTYNGSYVTFHGDGQEINSYSDIGVMFSTNAAGLDVFGGISNEVLGGIDLNPEITVDTPLSSLRGGKGISPNGALQISDGTNSVIVDISHASTVGDVARLIEAHPPAGRRVSATVTGEGLTLQLDASGGGNLTVKEVNSGKAASELGILETVGALTNPLIGSDLNPLVTKTTALESLLGAKAQTRLVSPGDNNDLILRAVSNGAQYNGAKVQFVDDELLLATPGVGQGAEYAQYDANARAARASLRFSGAGNDLTITATAAGVAFNDVDIVVNSLPGLGNAANAVYNPTTKQLEITIDDADGTTIDAVRAAIDATGVFQATSDESAEGPLSYNGAAIVQSSDAYNVQGNTGNSGGAAKTLYVFVRNNASTANNVAAAINAQGLFTAEIDSLDSTNVTQAGSRPISLTSSATFSGGAGAQLDLASGIRVVSGASTYTLSFSQANTVEDLLNIINGSEAGLHAEINADGSGINLRSRLSGANLQIGENGGTTATQLGLRSLTGATRLDQLNHGVGVPAKRDSYSENPPSFVADFTITASDGVGTVDMEFDVSGAETVQDVIDLINNHSLNNAAGVAVVARLNATGNGIELVDQSGEPLTITAAEGSQAAEYLGLVPAGQTSATNALGTLSGADRNYLETESVFTTLIRMKDALASNDIGAIERAIAGIDADLDRVTFSRSEVGARQQALDVTEQNLEDEDVQLRSALSEEMEVDLVEAISNLTARQLSLEASLRATANILQLSLLSFL